MSSSVQFYLAIFIFLMTYAGIMSEKIHRTICALAGGGAMIYFGLVTQEQAITEFIDFNTLGLLTGMMILISVVKQSGTCVVGAEEIKGISAGAADFAFYRHGGGGGAH